MQKLNTLVNPLDIDVVFIHGDCPDGATSANLIDNFQRTCRREGKLKVIPVTRNQCAAGEIPLELSELDGVTLAIVDFTYNKETLAKITATAKNFVVIDHHPFGMDLPEPHDHIYNGGGASAALLTFWYCFGASAHTSEFLELIHGRDNWDHPDLQRCHCLFHGMYQDEGRFSYELFCTLTNEIDALENMVKAGSANITPRLEAFEAESRQLEIFEEDAVVVTTGPEWDILSELGDHLMAKANVNLVILMRKGRKEGTYDASIRGRGDMNVGPVCQQLGGGGRAHTGGFQALPEERAKELGLI